MSELLLDPTLQDLHQGGQGHQQQQQPEVPSSSWKGSARPNTSQHQRETETRETAFIDGEDILQEYELAVERAQTWTGPARFGFNAMLASPNYKNKLRLKPDKMERIIHFLTVPAAKSREKDRADAQAKHQAQHWKYEDGILYRKESRLDQPRRHISATDIFDVLTAEHLRSRHHGRDKMLKVLEAKYIGYTKDELMYVLDRCLVCSSKHLRGAAGRRRENKQSNGSENGEGGPGLDEMTFVGVNDIERPSIG